jgi:prevent-host-death family protein
MNSLEWSISEARTRFSELIAQSERKGPQTITRNRRIIAVVVSNKWERKRKRKRNLAEFFASSPLRNSGAQIRRMRGRVRKSAL